MMRGGTGWSISAPILALIFLLAQMSAEAADRHFKRRLSHLAEINLESGLNDVRFDSLKLRAKIFVAQYETGTAFFDRAIYCVTTSPVEGPGSKPAWKVISVGDKSCTADRKDEGDNVVDSVRFFNGRLDAEVASIVFIASRNIDDPKNSTMADATTVTITVYELMSPSPDAATDVPYFQPISQFKTRRFYCDADAALWKELGVTLPAGHEDRCSKH